MTNLIQTATQTPSEMRKLALSKIAASIINKWLNGKTEISARISVQTGLTDYVNNR